MHLNPIEVSIESLLQVAVFCSCSTDLGVPLDHVHVLTNVALWLPAMRLQVREAHWLGAVHSIVGAVASMVPFKVAGIVDVSVHLCSELAPLASLLSSELGLLMRFLFDEDCLSALPRLFTFAQLGGSELVADDCVQHDG